MSAIEIDIARLCLAALLGGIIGLERETKHRPAGLRTNLFICVGAALFTILSEQLGSHSGENTRIASQIIPGIGFIGAGSILHARGDLVTGITTAATIFVVASVGMAVGGGIYWIAIFTTALILCVLLLLGLAERWSNLKLTVHAYEVTGKDAAEITSQLNGLLEPLHAIPQNVAVAPTPQHIRVRFECEGTHRMQLRFDTLLRQSGVFDSVASLGPVQIE